MPSTSSSYKIVYDNSILVVVDKSSGVLSTPSRFEKEDTRVCVGRELEKDFGHQIYPVHRLDFEVSGLIVFAKTPDSHRVLNKAFEEHLVNKTYHALSTPGSLSEWNIGQEYIWKAKILRGKKRAYPHDAGKESVTHAKFLGEKLFENSPVLEWELSPKTGRPHQLRWEMFRHEMPILGDKLYGSVVNLNGDSICLRAFRLELDPLLDEVFKTQLDYEIPLCFEVEKIF